MKIFLLSMAMSCITSTASVRNPPIKKSTLCLLIASSMALVASGMLRNSLESTFTSSMGRLTPLTEMPPSLLISSAARVAPFQCPSPWVNCIGPITPIFMGSARGGTPV